MSAPRQLGREASVGQGGFSLVEMLVSLTVFSVVLGMVFAFLDQAGRNLETEANGVETHQGARVALDEMGLLVQQAGFGIDRGDPSNPATWQRAVLHAGPHALAFNANLDADLGAIGPDVTLNFPNGSSYVGEGDDESTAGAETYYYTLDANDDGRISSADRWASAAGSYNPAASTDNPLDYALFRRVYGFDGEGVGGAPVALTPYLFTNATVTDDYGDGTSPEPLFTYWLSEDVNGDDQLSDTECVIPPCPSGHSRRPRIYLWGDSDFDGELSEAEKEALRSLPVGDPGWWPNPLAASGHLHDTNLSDAVDPGATVLEVDDATGFAPGQHVELGQGGLAERTVISGVDTSGYPDRLVLATAVRWPHAYSDSIRVLPSTLLQAIRTIELTFGAIRPERDFNSAAGAPAPGHAGRVGTRGLDYRVVSFERRFGLPNLRTRPVERSDPMSTRTDSRTSVAAPRGGRVAERGSALIVAMFVALVVTGLCTTMLLTSNANHLISANERDHDRALFASKAGLNYAYYLFSSQLIQPSAEGTAFDSFDEAISGPLDGGSFVGRLFDDGSGLYRLVSTGIYRRASRTTEVVLTTTPSAFKHGFVGYDRVELHMHSPYDPDGLEVKATVFSNNWVEIHSGIHLDGSIVASGTVQVQQGDVPTRIDGDVYAYSIENNGIIDGDVTLLTSVKPTHDTPDVIDDVGNPYEWYLDRSNPDSGVAGSGTITGDVTRQVVQDGDPFRSSIFGSDGSLLDDPQMNVVRPMDPPKLDYQAMKAAALKNDPTYFRTAYQAKQYLKANRVTETIDGVNVTTIKVGRPDRPEFIYVQEDLTIDLDPDHVGGIEADGLHIEGGIYTAGDFTFKGVRFEETDDFQHPPGYEQLRINSLPYCLPAIISYSEPRYGSNSDWTPEDTPPMMSENKSIIKIRSHWPIPPPRTPAYEGPIYINGLTYAENESHFHHMIGEKEKIVFNGAQLGFIVHNCDQMEFTYDPAVSCTQFLDVSSGSAGGESTIVSYRELR